MTLLLGTYKSIAPFLLESNMGIQIPLSVR
jgi:hypothetical protein